MFTVLKSFVGGYVRNSILIRYDSIRQLSLKDKEYRTKCSTFAMLMGISKKEVEYQK